MRGNRHESELISSGHSSNIYFGSVISARREGGSHTKVVEGIDVFVSKFSFKKPRSCSKDQSATLMRTCEREEAEVKGRVAERATYRT